MVYFEENVLVFLENWEIDSINKKNLMFLILRYFGIF